MGNTLLERDPVVRELLAKVGGTISCDRGIYWLHPTNCEVMQLTAKRWTHGDRTLSIDTLAAKQELARFKLQQILDARAAEKRGPVERMESLCKTMLATPPQRMMFEHHTLPTRCEAVRLWSFSGITVWLSPYEGPKTEGKGITTQAAVTLALEQLRVARRRGLTLVEGGARG